MPSLAPSTPARSQLSRLARPWECGSCWCTSLTCGSSVGGSLSLRGRRCPSSGSSGLQVGSSPSRTAMESASSLECAPSLAERFAMWLRTVCTLTLNEPAIAAFDIPSASSASTSRSRSVSSPCGAVPPPRCRRGSSRASISGEITASPAAAARTAEVTSWRLRVLETNPAAPASIAATRTWSAALAVSTTMRTLGPDRRAARRSRRPRRRPGAGGRAAPRRGSVVPSSRRAWASVPAMPTTSSPGWSSRTRARLALSTSWSSTISTRTGRSSGGPGASGRSGGVSMALPRLVAGFSGRVRTARSHI